MSNKKCEDGSEVSLRETIKSLFKTVGCGLDAGIKEFNSAAIEAEKWAREKRNTSSIMHVEKFGITYLDGARIENPELATDLSELITKAITSEDYDFKEIIELAMVHNLDISSILSAQRRHR